MAIDLVEHISCHRIDLLFILNGYFLKKIEISQDSCEEIGETSKGLQLSNRSAYVDLVTFEKRRDLTMQFLTHGSIAGILYVSSTPPSHVL